MFDLIKLKKNVILKLNKKQKIIFSKIIQQGTSLSERNKLHIKGA